MLQLFVDLNRVVFQYNCIIDYSSYFFVRIDPIEVVWGHCGALKFAEETLSQWECGLAIVASVT